MRPALRGALMLAGALAASPGAAAAAPAAPPSAPAPRPAKPAPPPDATLVYYPAKARADGVDGSAVLKCTRNEHLALTGCSLVSENPAGEGFGQAALAMAAQSKPNPDVDEPRLKDQRPFGVQVHFALHAQQAVSPDLTQVPHLVTRPSIVTKPTTAQLLAGYPERALSDKVDGGAIIDCRVTLEGILAECQLLKEVPTGYGFGQAALDLAVDFRMKPATVDGKPISGAEAPIVIPFRSSDPDAPLTLDTKKPGRKPDDASPPP